jgi:adenosylcobinamide kinase / adenosylcobinamide-phosphate guanylyltransferase
MYIFVTGGFRSGRSSYALRRAAELGPPPWLYVTAGEEEDEAVRARIERQRRDKEAIWRTGVMAPDLMTSLAPPALEGLGAVVLDGFPSWLAGRLAARPQSTDEEVLEEIDRVADGLYRAPVPIVIVSQEMGLGTPPSDPGQLRFATLTAGANQILATTAGSVVLMVSGVPLKVR